MPENEKEIPTPPICPGCGEPLTVVCWEVDPDNYEWDGKNYVLKLEGAGSTTCPKCDAYLGDLFPDGPVNYDPKAAAEEGE
jgi:hypothetical protein